MVTCLTLTSLCLAISLSSYFSLPFPTLLSSCLSGPPLVLPPVSVLCGFLLCCSLALILSFSQSLCFSPLILSSFVSPGWVEKETYY